MLQEEADAGEVTVLRRADEVIYPLRLEGFGRAARGLSSRTLARPNRHFITANGQTVVTTWRVIISH